MVEVTVYGKPGCHQCRATARKLNQLDVPYEYADVTAEQRHYDAVKFLGYSQLPVVLAGDIHWSGFSPDRLTKLAEILRSEDFQDRMSRPDLELAAQNYLREELQ